MSAASWFHRPTGTRPVLWCFPYAGGGINIFRGWDTKLDSWVEVCPVILPGRDMRFSEPCLETIEDLAGHFIEATVRAGLNAVPQAFLGHSMGAAIAYEAAAMAETRQRTDTPTSLLVVGGRASPCLQRTSAPLHALPDDALRRQLGELGGTPAKVLENDELMELMLPMIRSDFKAIETWASECPVLRHTFVVAIGAELDKESQPAQLQNWQRVSEAGTELHQIKAAGHFCIHSHRGPYLDLVVQAVARWCTP